MPLPYSKPNVTYDHIIDLNKTDIRTFNNSTYDNKHILIIPKTGIDTAKGLVFTNLASVTIIGGHFRPAAKAWGTYSSGSKAPATLTFNGVSDAYLEGVITDNINLFVNDPDSGENGGDAIFFSAGNSETPVARRGGRFTAQNCAFVNVRGIETLPAGSGTNLRAAHGDFFQVGSTTMGKAGVCRFYNITASGNYQGFFMDPQRAAAATSTRTYYPGGNSGIIMQRVNLKRTAAAPGNRLIFLISSEENYNLRGYPATFDDVWCQGWGTETIEGTVWPNHTRGTNTLADKYLASYGTDNIGRYAEWKGLQDPGKQITGKVYQGSPPQGDFAPLSKIGLNYVEGSEPSDPGTPTVPAEPTSYTNLLRPGQTWTPSTAGTTAVDPLNGQLTITSDGTATAYLRMMVPTVVNRRYELTWSNDTAAVSYRQVGTSAGGADLVPVNVSVTGDNKREITATSAQTWVQFQRPTSGTVTVSNPTMMEIQTGTASARRLNGKNQFFLLDVQSNLLRMANNNWFIGGWVSFTYMPAAPVYFMDFGRLDPGSTAGGAGRMRLFYDPDQKKIACSTSELSGGSYRENYLMKPMQVDTWYYVGMIARPTADVQLVVGTQRGASYIGTVIPAASASDICRVLQIGARVVSPRASFAPCRFSNWVWASNWVPSDVQINALADGKRPENMTDLVSPPGGALYHWPMAVESGDEPSLRDAGTMVSNSTYGSPITVQGPMLDAPIQSTAVPLDVIVV